VYRNFGKYVELENLYTIKNQKFAEIEYMVDVEKGICSCSLGYDGQLMASSVSSRIRARIKH